jgi:linoleoyl-CoA desaturase
MTEATFKAVRFAPQDDRDFGIAVRKRVAEYFKNKGVARTGDYRIWIKVVVMPLIYLLPFGLVLSGLFVENLLIFYALWIVMGIGIAGCGLGIMHDANHGSLSPNKKTNRFVGLILDFIGGFAFNWRIQHNVLHHSFTNVDGFDEDIDPGSVMRFSPHQPHKPIHRFQVFYAWFLYGLMTFSWVTWKDFQQLKRYDVKGLIATQGSTYKKELTKLIISKVLYYCYSLILPLAILDMAWWNILIPWFLMHFTAGLILALVFQPAHVMPDAEFPLPDKDNAVAGDFAKYQLLTTANFAPTNRVLSWYVGGLNYQIEHHLFPNMCHVHHREVSKIVKATAEEYGLPYHTSPTFFGAIANHWRMLGQLGRPAAA